MYAAIGYKQLSPRKGLSKLKRHARTGLSLIQVYVKPKRKLLTDMYMYMYMYMCMYMCLCRNRSNSFRYLRIYKIA